VTSINLRLVCQEISHLFAHFLELIFSLPNPNKPEPNKIYFYHENTNVRKHEKENLISHFLFFRGFVIVFNSFANFACLRACLSAVPAAQAGADRQRTGRHELYN